MSDSNGINKQASRPLRLLRNVIVGIITAALLLALLAVVGGKYVPPYRPALELSSDSEALCRRMAQSITEPGVRADLAALCATPSRMIGGPGYEPAIKYIRNRFQKAGLQHVVVLRQPVAVPVTKDARLEVLSAEGAAAEELPIHPFWPNLVRTCTVPPAGLTGPLIDAAGGNLREFDGLDVQSAVVLLDANCDRRWLNAPLLGAAAVIFCGTQQLTREQAEQKSLITPVNVPRFFVNDTVAARLRSLAAAGNARVRIFCKVDFENQPAATVCGILPGTDATVGRETLVLESYFDSISEVPDLAEGGEAACGTAALLQAVDSLAQARPRRTVVFVANGAHFQGQGFARFLQVLGPRTCMQASSVGFARSLAHCDARLARARTRLALCRRLHELVKLAEPSSPGPDAWRSADSDLKKMLVRDLQISVKDVLDDAYEAERTPGAAPMPRARRLLLQRMCWEADLENFRTRFWDETARGMGNVRRRAARRLADTSDRIARLQGEREFLGSMRDLDVRLFLGLDLSSGTGSFGIFERGNPDGPPYEGRGPVQPLAERLAVFADGLAGIAYKGGMGGLPPFVDGFKSIGKVSARSALIAMLKFDAEACYGPNWTGATFCTLDDSRPYVATPNDTLSRVNTANVAAQARLMAPMLKILLDDPAPLAGESDLHDHSGIVTVRAMTVPRGGAIVPDHPVEHAIVVDRATAQERNAWYLNIKPYSCGVREDNIAIADEEGAVTFPTYWHDVWTQPPRPFEAYRLDPETGEITHAIDRGVSGTERFPNTVILDRREKEGMLVMFRCQPMALFGLLDQRYMSLLRRLDVYGAEEDSPPLQYGWNLSTQPAGGHETETSGESCAVVYVEPGKKFKVTMSAGIMGLRLALLNMPAVDGVAAAAVMENESGSGYAPSPEARLPLTPWRAARDMWRLDEIRIRSLKSRGIQNELLDQLHGDAAAWLQTADDAFARREYSTAMSASLEAWAFESRAYPLVRSAADDAITGVIFYLFLLLPFSFFAERLLFGFPKIVHRIFGTAGVFVAVFIILRFTHPAFKLATSPVMVLLAFITLALSLLVICLLGGKVADQLRKLRQREETRSIDVNRLSTLRAAFMLGLANLRKRPIRSSLTALTLILMSFTVVSFTSVKFVPRYNKIDANQPALYDGILVKRPQWAPLDAEVLASLDSLYGRQYAVVPRGWYAGLLEVSIPGRKPPLLEPTAGTPPAAPEHEWPVVLALTGLDVRESEVTHIHERLTAGRWFSSSDAEECIVPSDLAKKLEITPADAGHVALRVRDRLLQVAGIIDSAKLIELMDLNAEPITPIDYTVVQTTSKSKQETASDHYRHFLPEYTLLVPYGVAKSFGRSVGGSFTLASVAVAMDRPAHRATAGGLTEDATERIIRRFMSSKAVNLYAGIGGRSYFYNVPGMLSFSGLKSIALPLAIAFLIVLNTMLGAVYERFKDIYIFSSIGLAPSHIGTLFLAESCVFATIGGVTGYLMGQVFSVFCTQTGWLSGLTLNYSSGSVVTAMLVVMGVVIASALYPAHKASRLASPSVDRKWTLPPSAGDILRMELPFLVEQRDAAGLVAFVGQYLRAHREAGVGRFVTENVSVDQSAACIRLAAHVWMAPYDMGVSQNVTLQTGEAVAASPTGDGGVCPLRLELVRVSGEPRSWRKTTFIFLDALRKQFLRWRTVPEAERRRYAADPAMGGKNG